MKKLFDSKGLSKSPIVATNQVSAEFLNKLGKAQAIFDKAQKLDHSAIYDVCYFIAQRLHPFLGGFIKRQIFSFSQTAPITSAQFESAKRIEKLSEELPEVAEIHRQTRLLLQKFFDSYKEIVRDYESFLFAQEYSTKTIFDKLFPAHFDFDRSIHPVTPDNCWEQKILDFLDYIFVKKRGFVGSDGRLVSLEDHGKEALLQTPTGKNLKKVRELKAKGKRVWILASHPAYTGAVMPRYVLCATGFEDIAQNWNAICGPRVVANTILEPGAKSIGNIFMTLPSEETTPIKTPGLSAVYSPLVRKTLKLVKGMINGINWNDGEQEFFEKIKKEVFIVWPEGSRSTILSDGTIALKYIDPAFFRGFVQEGNFVVPMNQCGAEKINPKGSYLLKRAEVALSVGEPVEVTKEMLEKQNAPAQVLTFIEQICALPLPNGQKVIYPFKLDGSLRPEYAKYRNEIM